MYGILVGLLQPFGWLMWGTAIALCWTWKRHPELRSKLCLPTALFAAVFVYSLPLTAWLSSTLLEQRFPRVTSRPDNIQVIVVLGADAIPPTTSAGVTQPGLHSLVRAYRAAELYQEGPPCHIIVSGGKPEPSEPGDSPAETMLQFLQRAGVPDHDLILEQESHNTAENARFTAELLRERGWTDRVLLVTSAPHLWRAQRMFARQNIEVIPAGCEYQTDQIDGGLFLFWPRSSAIAANQAIFHEAIGFLIAWCRGEV